MTTMAKKVIPDSEMIVNPDGSIFHIHLHPDQLRDNIIIYDSILL